jgi:hypothetical protein
MTINLSMENLYIASGTKFFAMSAGHDITNQVGFNQWLKEN